MLWFSDILYMLVRYASSSSPMCLMCLILTLSGPVELLFLLFAIAAWTCIVVSVILVVFSYLCVCLCGVFLFDCVGELFVESVCYLCECGKCFLFERYCVVFGLCRFLLANPCMVFQRVCVLCCDPSVCLGVPSTWQFVFLYEGCDFRV